MASAVDQIVTAATDTAPRSGKVRATVPERLSIGLVDLVARAALAGLDASAWTFAAIEIKAGSPHPPPRRPALPGSGTLPPRLCCHPQEGSTAWP